MSDTTQLKIIHSLVRDLGCTDDEYRDMLYSQFKVNSSKHLSDDDARTFILCLKEKLGIAGGKKWDHLAGRPGSATPAQLRMLEAMWKEVSKMRSPRERREALEALLRNRLSVRGGLLWLEQKDVQRAVKLLKAMKADQAKAKAEGWTA